MSAQLMMMRMHGRRKLRRLLRALVWAPMLNPGPAPDFQHFQAA